jgi:hypothetical protein
MSEIILRRFFVECGSCGVMSDVITASVELADEAAREWAAAHVCDEVDVLDRKAELGGSS